MNSHSNRQHYYQCFTFRFCVLHKSPLFLWYFWLHIWLPFSTSERKMNIAQTLQSPKLRAVKKWWYKPQEFEFEKQAQTFSRNFITPTNVAPSLCVYGVWALYSCIGLHFCHSFFPYSWMKPGQYTLPEPQADSSPEPEPTLEAELKSEPEPVASFALRTDGSSGLKAESTGPEPLESSSNICNKVEETEKWQECRRWMDRKNEVITGWGDGKTWTPYRWQRQM